MGLCLYIITHFGYQNTFMVQGKMKGYTTVLLEAVTKTMHLQKYFCFFHFEKFTPFCSIYLLDTVGIRIPDAQNPETSEFCYCSSPAFERQFPNLLL